MQCGDDASSADLDLHPYSIVPHSTIYIKKFQSSPVPCFHVSNTNLDYIHTQSNYFSFFYRFHISCHISNSKCVIFCNIGDGEADSRSRIQNRSKPG